jgi:hypothetical protein
MKRIEVICQIHKAQKIEATPSSMLWLEKLEGSFLVILAPPRQLENWDYDNIYSVSGCKTKALCGCIWPI